MRLYEMTDSQLNAAVERYYDRMYDRYYSNDEDAWEHNNPDYKEVQDILADYDEDKLAEYVREEIEGNGDLMVEICNEGLLEEFIAPEDKWKLKDPDDQFELVDDIFEKQWQNNELMITIWERSDKVCEGICKRLWERANEDYNDEIRQKYNKSKED